MTGARKDTRMTRARTRIEIFDPSDIAEIRVKREPGRVTLSSLSF